MTIYELKRLNEANGGVFFSRRTMHFWGDTLKNFSLRVLPDVVEVSRKHGRPATWTFDKTTGRMIS